MSPPPTTSVLLVALWGVLSAGAPARADTRVTQPYVGVTIIVRGELCCAGAASPRPVTMHIARVDLRAPGVRLAVSAPAGGREAVRQTTLAFLRERGAQLAVNAHFFLPFPSADAEAWVIGLAASQGRVFSSFETPVQRYALVADAPALNVDSRGRARIVHRDPRDPSGRRVRERVRVWNAVAGSAAIVASGRVSLPEYRDRDHPRGTLEPGGPGGYGNTRSWYDVVTARTAVGLSRDNRTLTIFTVDARGGSEGMRVGEVAALLVADYGVWHALSLDGGGSTTLAWVDPATGAAELLNTPSDGPDGRAVATSLAVFARRR